MRIEIRADDPIRPHDDVVLRAGGGSVETLLARAIDNAADYEPLAAAGTCRSAYTISVHVPRNGVATLDELLAAPPYVHYRPYLETDASRLLQLGYVEILPTTIIHDGQPPAPSDLCHYDLVVEATNIEQLSERIRAVREQFSRHDNPAYWR